MCLDLKYLVPNKDTRQKGNVLSTRAALQSSTRTEVQWHNIHLGRDERTHIQMWSHSHWQSLTDPFHHGSHASLSLHRYHSSVTCLCLTAHLTQTKHPSSSHGLTHSLPCSAGSLPQATALQELFLRKSLPWKPQKFCNFLAGTSPAAAGPGHQESTSHSTHIDRHRHIRSHQCQTQPGAAQARETPSEQGNPNRIGTDYKGWPTPLFLFPLLPSLPQASRALGAHGGAVDAGAVKVGFFPFLLFALQREKAKHIQSKCWHPSCHSTAAFPWIGTTPYSHPVHPKALFSSTWQNFAPSLCSDTHFSRAIPPVSMHADLHTWHSHCMKGVKTQ